MGELTYLSRHPMGTYTVQEYWEKQLFDVIEGGVWDLQYIWESFSQPRNACDLIKEIFFPKVIFSKAVHSWKVDSLIEFTLLGMEMLFNFSHFSNAPISILDRLLGNSILDKLLQPKKADIPIEVILLFSTIVVRFLHSKKVKSSIVETLFGM